MPYESFADKIKFRSGKFDEELFRKIVEYLIENKIVTPESVEAYRNGLEVTIPALAELEIADEFNIDPVQAIDYLSLASHLISLALIGEILGYEQTDELEKYIVEKLYAPEIKQKYLVRKFMTNPILEDIDVIKFEKKTSEGPITSYGIRILVDESGDRDFEEYFFETSLETLESIVRKLNEVISNDFHNETGK